MRGRSSTIPVASVVLASPAACRSTGRQLSPPHIRNLVGGQRSSYRRRVAMTERPPYTLARLTLYFLKLGSIGFGGPVALVGYMYRDLVETRHWISDDDYKEGLTLAQLMPGPLAAQLAMYLGYVHFRIVGATVVGVAFVLPSFLMVLAIGWAYMRYGGLPWMQAVFYGVGAAVIGIIAVSAYKLSPRK